MRKAKPSHPSQGPSVFSLLGPYLGLIVLLAALATGANALTLWLPKVLSHAIDSFIRQEFVIGDVAWQFGLLGFGIFILTALQTVVQTYTSERVAKDLRNDLISRLSKQHFAYIQKIGSARLLTNLTSDMDALKLFVSMAISNLVSSAVLIVGAAVLLLLTDWKLALLVLLIVPIIGITFFTTLKKVRSLFFQSRAIIDRLNQVINESILGSALIRVLFSQAVEYDKFIVANADSRDIGLSIVRIFAGLIPVITFIANMATVIILVAGGHFVINGTLTLGDYASFSSYVSILIFPILVLGFMSNVIAQANASYGRIREVMDAPIHKETGTKKGALSGAIEVEHLTISYGEKKALSDVSFGVKPGSKVAIIGPTAAGKSQLLYALTGLIKPESGQVLYDGIPIEAYDPESLYRQIGFVFQDSIIFNMTLRENIAFSLEAGEADLHKAIQTAELSDLIESLPDGLDTMVSERGASLSGGQKQRLMLARALALNPKILLLDDFTARVDINTEAKILANVQKYYPELTLVSVTQKVASVEHYDQILVLMESELLAQGTHKELLKTSPEYVQMFKSGQSTNNL